MKKKTIALALGVMMAVCLVLGTAAQVCAAADPVDEFALAYVSAVEAGYAQFETVTASGDMDKLLNQVFIRYPVLFHYYDGGSWTYYPDHTEVTISLKNTPDALADVWIVGSDEELLAVLGMGLAQLRANIAFVTEPGYVLSDEKMQNAMDRLYHQYYLAYMGYYGWSSTNYYREECGIEDYSITFSYRYDLNAETLQQWRNETEQVALTLAGSLFAQDMPDYEKVLRIHDWIVNQTRYNNENMEQPGNHLAYGAMVKGSCVCMGYAEAGLLLFQAAGIETVYVGGTGTNSSGQTESHGWNAVKVDGQWYMLDITWDDPTTSDGSDVLRYDYFLLTDSQLSQDHTWERAGIPVCSGTQWDADKVLAASEQDTTVYTQYDPSVLMTQEKAKSYFQQFLRDGTGNLPAAVEEEPEEEKPIQTWVEMPIDEPEGSDTETGAETEKGSGTVVIFCVAAVVVGIGAGVFGVIRHKQEQERKRRRRRQMNSYDWNQPW